MRSPAALVVFAVLVFGISTPVASADPPRPGMSPDDLRRFLDDFFGHELGPQGVVGAAVAVVRDGQVLAARGYGFADRETERPVDAERTLFPAQSVSKLFAATAVMQLAERGLVDLDADVRDNLGEVSLDSEFAEPVTLAHLLTHTAGFDDSYVGLLPRDADDIISVPEYLNRYRRRVVYPPGTVHAYSNYSSLMARHVVEVVTGRPYEEYLVEEIVRPLQMEQSCVLPPPSVWSDRFATGYLPSRDGLESTREAFPDGLVRFHMPTGTLASTVVDMTHFMIAHLEGGSFEGNRILEPETVRTMHGQQFAQHPLVPGVTYGFFESAAGGERGLFHFGSGFGYGTFLYLLPDLRTGFYLAHSNSASRIAEAFLTAFLDRYLGRSDLVEPDLVAPRSPDVDNTNAAGLAGYYLPVRRPQTTFETLPMGLVQAHFRAPDGATLANDQILPREWRRTAPRVFERTDGQGIVAFDEPAARTPLLASVWDAEAPELLVLERVPWYDTMPLLLARLGWFLLVFVAAVVAYPFSALMRRIRRSSVRRRVPGLGATTVGAAALNLGFLLGVAWVFVSRDWMYSVSGTLVAIFWLPLLAIPLTGLAVAGAIRDRTALAGERFPHVVRAIVLATLVLFPLFLGRWHLLGLHY